MLARARLLVGKHALAARRRVLLAQCWRALALHAAAGRCLADRRRFRELATSASAGGLSLAPASVMNSREGLPPGALKRMMFD